MERPLPWSVDRRPRPAGRRSSVPSRRPPGCRVRACRRNAPRRPSKEGWPHPVPRRREWRPRAAAISPMGSGASSPRATGARRIASDRSTAQPSHPARRRLRQRVPSMASRSRLAAANDHRRNIGLNHGTALVTANTAASTAKMKTPPMAYRRAYRPGGSSWGIGRGGLESPPESAEPHSNRIRGISRPPTVRSGQLPRSRSPGARSGRRGAEPRNASLSPPRGSRARARAARRNPTTPSPPATLPRRARAWQYNVTTSPGTKVAGSNSGGPGIAGPAAASLAEDQAAGEENRRDPGAPPTASGAPPAPEERHQRLDRVCRRIHLEPWNPGGGQRDQPFQAGSLGRLRSGFAPGR